MKAADLGILQIIPAQPGYFVLSAPRDDDRFTGVHRAPIIAWALESELLVPSPVTLEGMQTDCLAIELPNGQVESGSDGWFSDASAWLANIQHGCAVIANLPKGLQPPLGVARSRPIDASGHSQ